MRERYGEQNRIRVPTYACQCLSHTCGSSLCAAETLVCVERLARPHVEFELRVGSIKRCGIEDAVGFLSVQLAVDLVDQLQSSTRLTRLQLKALWGFKDIACIWRSRRRSKGLERP